MAHAIRAGAGGQVPAGRIRPTRGRPLHRHIPLHHRRGCPQGQERGGCPEKCAHTTSRILSKAWQGCWETRCKGNESKQDALLHFVSCTAPFRLRICSLPLFTATVLSRTGIVLLKNEAEADGRAMLPLDPKLLKKVMLILLLQLMLRSALFEEVCNCRWCWSARMQTPQSTCWAATMARWLETLPRPTTHSRCDPGYALCEMAASYLARGN